MPHTDFLKALLSGNRAKCSEISADLLNRNLSIKELYEKIIKQALYDIGELWERGKISVATEHLASAIVEANLNEQYYKVISNSKKNNKTVVAACLENEFHQIGIKMVSDIFEMNGWNAHFLGANTPIQELISFVKEVNPNLLAISMSIYFHLPTLEEMLRSIQKEMPYLPILIGGQGFRYGGIEIVNRYKNLIYLPDLNSLESFLIQINHYG